MQVADFDYHLPPELIAQCPAEPRDAARLLVQADNAGSVRHRVIGELAKELRAGDLLVLNDTRVRPARLFGRRRTGGAVELLLLGPSAPTHNSFASEGSAGSRAASPWRAMVRPAAKIKPGEILELEGGGLLARAIEREIEDGRPSAYWTVELSDPADPELGVEALLERSGHMPLPPYIQRERGGDAREVQDRERYQTVYARSIGAVAAPTAGLHFTTELLRQLQERGIERTHVTLHVGLGTFLPMTVEDTDLHIMHHEEYELSPESAQAIEACRKRGGRIVAVGTTSVRVLESCAAGNGRLRPGRGSTNLFIQPGYDFQCVDLLLTNFHLPRSTLLMLVSAFVGRTLALDLYREAVEQRYRFYSYGDAMLLSRVAQGAVG